MITSIISQPTIQLGQEINELLTSGIVFNRINLVSAFVSLSAILRLRESLLEQVERGCQLRITLGIDLGGTSREVLEELQGWNCETFIFHNAIPRSTFHPKVYLFNSGNGASLFIGSNNLTDGGLYTNYEICTRHDFTFPEDVEQYRELIGPLHHVIEPSEATALPLTQELLNALIVRGSIPSDAEIRRRNRNEAVEGEHGDGAPGNPFPTIHVPRPPLLAREARRDEAERPIPANGEDERQQSHTLNPIPNGILVWQKILAASDVGQTNPGSNPTGGVRLTQARFEDPYSGSRIDQTSYFRRLFDDYQWEQERNRPNQEHAYIPFRISIRGNDYGVQRLEVSHKPSGEAGQRNYTTILRWGSTFGPTIREANLTGATLSLFETADPHTEFLITIE